MEISIYSLLAMPIAFLFWAFILEPFVFPVLRDYVGGNGFNFILPKLRFVLLDALIKFFAFIALKHFIGVISSKSDK